MAKYVVCVGMGQTPAGVTEIQKDVTATAIEVCEDGTLVARNPGGEIIATFKQYIWCLEEGQIPVVKPARSLHQ